MKEKGSVKKDKILARKLRIDYATACERIDSYCDLDILVCENDVLSVKFISDQINELQEVSKKNSENASKRWAKKDDIMRPNANKKREEEIRDKKAKAKKSVEDRKSEFVEKVKKAWQEKQSDTQQVAVREFLDHWTEISPNGRKMGFELQRTFDPAKRLATWRKNNFNNNCNPPAPENTII